VGRFSDCNGPALIEKTGKITQPPAPASFLDRQMHKHQWLFILLGAGHGPWYQDGSSTKI
jgi:hypothetical protein